MKFLQVDINNEIAIVTLNREQSKNAMGFGMMQELVACAKDIRNNRHIRGVILTGSGQTFCSGLDLNDLKKAPKRFVFWELVKPKYSLFQAAALVWRDLPIPVIAAVEGHCLGAGVQLALAADIRIVHPQSTWSVLENRWGLVPDMGLTQTAAGLIQADVLKELTFSARFFSGTEAQSLGFATKLSTTPVEEAKKMLQDMFIHSPDALAAGKKLLNQMVLNPKAALRQEKTWQLKLLLSANQARAVKKSQGQAVDYLPRKLD